MKALRIRACGVIEALHAKRDFLNANGEFQTRFRSVGDGYIPRRSYSHGYVRRHRPKIITTWCLGLLCSCLNSGAEFYQVGPDRTYTNLQQIKALLLPGDVVEVDGDATYPGNVTFYNGGTDEQSVTVRGLRINGRRPILTGATITNLANVVAFRTNHIRFEGFEIDGANNPLVVRGIYNVGNENIVRDTVVHHCPQHGIHGSDKSGSLTLDSIEVYQTGSGTKHHPVYVATDNTNYPAAVFRMQFCFLHDNNGGNSVKSRAGRNEIYYNWIEGALYHELDLIGADPTAQAPNTAGLVREDSDVVGNVLYKNANSYGSVARLGDDDTGSSNGRYRFVNNSILTASTYSIALFKLRGPRESLELHNNVIYRIGGKGVDLFSAANPGLGVNDHIRGANNWIPKGSVNIPSGLINTTWGTDPLLTDATAMDFTPTNGSPLLDAGVLPTESPTNFPFPTPLSVPLYLPPFHTSPVVDAATPRPMDGSIDLGAIESLPLPPGIISQPVSQNILLLRTAEFAVTANGSGISENPLTYQWLFNGEPIPDATNPNYTLPVVTLADAGLYHVQVANVYGVATSAAAQLNVILDLTPPKVAITYPPTTVYLTSVPLALFGTANDNVGILNILTSLDGGYEWYPVDNLIRSPEGTYYWGTHLPIEPGTNIIMSVSIDAYTNYSPVVIRTYFYQKKAILKVQTVGNGSLIGKFSSSGTPADAAVLDINRHYTITALPASGCLFSNWLASVGDEPPTEVSTVTKYCFSMQSNLTLIAQFVTNEFIATAGKYTGLFYEDDGVRFESAGNFTLSVTAKQKFSGKLNVAGETLSFSGSFNVGGYGESTRPLTFKNQSDTLTVRLQLAFDGSDTISGSVSNNNNSTWVASLYGNRKTFSTANPCTAHTGKYTLVIPGADRSTDNASTELPCGDGYAKISVSPSGNLKLSGRLSDGTLLAQTVPLSRNGEWPLFCKGYYGLSNATTVSRGLIMGWLHLTNGIEGVVAWIKKPIVGDAYYPSGFTHETEVLGSAYTPPLNGTRLIELNEGNGLFCLSGGNLSDVCSNAVYLSTTNKFTVLTNSDLILKDTTATGVLIGTFRHPDDTNFACRLYGVVLQNSNMGHGYFLGPNESGTIHLIPGN